MCKSFQTDCILHFVDGDVVGVDNGNIVVVEICDAVVDGVAVVV